MGLIFRFRKGNTTIEVIFFLLVLCVIVLSSFVGNYILGEINTDIQNDDNMINESKTVVSEMNTNYSTIMDNAFILIFVLSWLAILVASYFIDTSPIFFIFGFVLILFVIIVGAIMGNVYADLLTQTEFSGYENLFPKTHFIMNNIVLVLLGVASSVLLLLYAKR